MSDHHTQPRAGLVGLVGLTLLAGCNNCGDDRSPLAIPEVRREDSGLLGTRLTPWNDRGTEGSGDSSDRDGPEARALGEAVPEDPVIAHVNDTTLHRSQLDARLQRRLALAGGDNPRRDAVWRNRERQRIARELVDEEMLRQLMAEEGVVVGEEELAAAAAAEIERVFHSEDHFRRYLERRDLTREAYTAQMRFELQLQRLLAAHGRPETTEADVLDYYQRFRENWRAAERVHAATIAVRLPREPSEEVVERARAALDELRAQVVARPERFETVATEHSQSPDRYRGGDLGWIYRDDPDLEPVVAQALFSLPVGQVSEPIRTRLGWQVYWVRDHRPEGYREFDEVRENLVDIVEQREEQALRMNLTHELEQRYEVGYNEEAFGLEPE